jgi:hypothetical protein
MAGAVGAAGFMRGRRCRRGIHQGAVSARSTWRRSMQRHGRACLVLAAVILTMAGQASPVQGTQAGTECGGFNADCFVILRAGAVNPFQPDWALASGAIEQGTPPFLPPPIPPLLGPPPPQPPPPAPLLPPPPPVPLGPPGAPAGALQFKAQGPSFLLIGIIIAMPPGAVPVILLPVVNSTGATLGAREVFCNPADGNGVATCGTGIPEPGIFPQRAGVARLRIAGLVPPPPPPPVPPPAPATPTAATPPAPAPPSAEMSGADTGPAEMGGADTEPDVGEPDADEE